MFEALAKICNLGGPLVEVTYSLFEGDVRSLTAVALKFESVSAVFRALEDDDTLAVTLGPPIGTEWEAYVDATKSDPW